MSIDRSLLNKLLKDFDQSIVNELIDKGFVAGYSAWRLYDYLKKYSKKIIYEDEDLNDRECYIVFLELITKQYFLLLKIDSDVVGYVVDKLDSELTDKLLKKYRECSKKQ